MERRYFDFTKAVWNRVTIPRPLGNALSRVEGVLRRLAWVWSVVFLAPNRWLCSVEDVGVVLPDYPFIARFCEAFDFQILTTNST